MVSSAPDPVEAQDWIEEVEDHSIRLEDLTCSASHPMKRVDVRLYVCILGSIKGPKLNKFYMDIETKASFGNDTLTKRLWEERLWEDRLCEDHESDDN